MEFTLKNTDVFDDNLYEKITNELHVLEDWYDPKLSYKLSVVFSSRLNHDNRMKEFYAKIPPKENQVKKEITVKDIVGDVLSFQLQKVVDAFRNYSGIEFDTAAIKGRVLEDDKNILVYVEPKGLLSKEKKFTVHSIMPDEDLTNERANEFLEVHYNRIFSEVLDTLKDKKLLAEILEVEDSEDTNLLFNTFIREYGTLFLTDKEREQRVEKFKNKALEVAAKHGIL